MIDKPLGELSEQDLLGLLAQKEPESKTIEYKRGLPDGGEQSRFRFLGAVTSLANTEGGDMIFGIDAPKGIPLAICPIQGGSHDEVKRRLEDWLKSCVEPRLPKVDFVFIPVRDGHVLVLRIEKSWSAPHRVKHGHSGPFYGRHSSGKFEMDVTELRAAFSQSEGVAERMHNYRSERLNRIHRHHTQMLVHLGCKLVLHVIPLSAFTSRDTLSLRVYEQVLCQFHPLGRDSAQNSKVLMDGVLNFANLSEGRTHAYCKVERNGVVEAVGVFTGNGDGHQYINSGRMEQYLIGSLGRYLQLMEKLDLSPPFYVFVALVGGTHFELQVPSNSGMGFDASKAEIEFMVPPEIVVSNPNEPAHRLLWPTIDMIWNAFGHAGSRNFNDKGDWALSQRPW